MKVLLHFAGHGETYGLKSRPELLLSEGMAKRSRRILQGMLPANPISSMMIIALIFLVLFLFFVL